jgi:hypothetical protein
VPVLADKPYVPLIIEREHSYCTAMLNNIQAGYLPAWHPYVIQADLKDPALEDDF